MSRRVLIRKADINRIISAYKNNQRYKKLQALLNQQGSNAKELAPNFYLDSVDFNRETRVAKITFIQEQQYRTIDRYVTRNYTKYPIYSDWKTKTKDIFKTLKLTNQVLETLDNFSDALIRRFSKDIIIAINDEDLMPSWFLTFLYCQEREEKLSSLNSQLSERARELKKDVTFLNNEFNKLNKLINEKTIVLHKIETKLTQANEVLNFINTSKFSILKSVFTLFVFNYLISNARKVKYSKKAEGLNNKIQAINEEINKFKSQQSEYKQEINNKEKNFVAYKNDIDVQKDNANKEYELNISKIRPLPTTYEADRSFIPLSALSGLEYKKIIGCYVIHNTINDKYYVGQSKDVIKRIRQHFKGTVPNNIIFAEDYFSVDEQYRNNLFEIKIIECTTKDELDKTERQLIADYDAFNSGYNGTNGNT